MDIATTKMSSKGQIVIPSEMREGIHEGVHLEPELREGETPVERDLHFRLWFGWIAVTLGWHDIDSLRGEGDLERLRRRAHGEKKPAVSDIPVDHRPDVPFQDRHLVMAGPNCHLLVDPDFLKEPVRISVIDVKFAVLPGKIFMVKV